MFPPLNLPPSELNIRSGHVWDQLRNKMVKLTPEEWVRQHFINFLIDHKSYPKGLLASEYSLKYGDLNVRADIVLFNTEMKPKLIVECKAPKIELTENTFYQVAKYAATLNPKYFILTNGLAHICGKINSDGKLEYLKEIPDHGLI